jgi:iron(III) transport system substrate-binding protein
MAITGMAACADPEAAAPDAKGATGPSVVSGSMAEVCAAGQKEGKLVSWNSEDPDAFQKIFNEFSKTYPGITLQSVSVRPDEVTQRVVTESAAGRPPEADALSITQDKSGPLVENGLLDNSIDWSAMGVGDSYVLGKSMVRTERIAIGLAYNTAKVNVNDLPATWEGLVNSQFAGKVVVDPRGDPLQLLAIAWGKDKTVNFVKQLKAAARPVVVQGATAGLLTVASGENLVTTNGRSAETAQQQANGAPIAIHYLDVVPGVDYYTAVPKGASHPNAGACWTAWLNSQPGRAAKQTFAFKGNVDLPEEAKGGTLAAIKSPQDAALVTDTAKAISDVWSGRS